MEKKQYEGPDTLSAAREWLAEEVENCDHVICPCCDRNAGYEVRLGRGNVTELLRFFRLANDDAARNGGKLLKQQIHVADRLGATASSYSENQLSSLQHFGLVEKSGPRGFWNLTLGGLQFVIGTGPVPKAVWVFRGEQVRVIDETPVVAGDLVSGRVLAGYLR